MAEKILYKNHCTPQEQVSVDGRYYLDGDCGRKLTGTAVLSGLTASPVSTVTTDTSLGTGKDFVSITLVSGADIDISLTGSGGARVIQLKVGECFASKIHASAEVYIDIIGRIFYSNIGV
mgnify:CR=1 FL=1